MYYISRIYMENFISHKNSTIEFDAHDKLIFIRGLTDDPFKSNGAGKSAIYYAIMFNIFGTVPNRTLEELLNKNVDDNKFTVDVIYKSENKDFQIIRTVTVGKTIRHDVRIIDNNQDLMFQKKDKAQEYIENELLGINKDLFLVTNFLTSNNSSILSFTPVQRTKLFETVLNISVLNDLYTKANDDLKNIKTEISTLETKSKMYTEEKEKYIKLKEFSLNSKNEEYIKKIQEYDNKLTEINNNIKSLQDAYADKLKQVKSLENLNKQLDTISSTLSEIDTVMVNAKSKYHSLVATKNEKAKLINENKCPTCGRAISDTFKSKLIHFVDDLEKKAKKLDTDLQTLNKIKSKLTKSKESLIALRDELSKLTDKMVYLDKEKQNLLEYKSKLTESYSRDDVIANIDINIQTITNEISNINKNIASKNEELQIIELITNILSPKSNFRNQYITKYLNIISYISNKYISIFYPNDNVKLNIKYDNDSHQIYTQFMFNNTEINYNLLSNGERKKMDIVFYFALIEYLYNYTKNSINLGVFIADETFDGLDNTSMMLLLDILNIFKDSTNIQIFMTSHNNSISIDYFDKTVTVKKDETTGISEIL